MAMLGMQADMQSNYPGHCSFRDLNLNANCSIWPLNNDDNFVMNGLYFNHNLNLSSMEQQLSHKERLKQTMLQQEAIFREQICELHRLYSRQAFITASENNPSHLSYDNGKTTRVGCEISQADVLVKEIDLSESKCKRVGNKLMDLELPADEYIESVEDESSARVRVPLVEEEEMPRYHLNSIYEDAQRANEEWSLGKRDLNLVFQEDSMTQPPSSRKSTGLADLNEPIVLEESNEPDPEIDNAASHVTDYTEVSCQDLPEKTNLDTQVQPKEIIQNPQMHQACSNILDMVKKESQLDWTNSLFENDEAGPSSSVLDSFPEGNSETFSISSGDSEIEQAPEVSTFNSLDNRSREPYSNGQAFGSVSSDDDCPGLAAEACEYTSNQSAPLADSRTHESLFAPCRKHDNAFVRVPIAVQAFPCFKNSEGFRGSTKDVSTRISGGNSHHRKNIKYKRKVCCLDVQRNFSEEEVEFEFDNTCSGKHMKGSGNVKHIRDIDLNSMSPCNSSDAAEVVWVTGGENNLEDLTEPILVGDSNKKCKRTKIELKPACLKASRISIPDDESKKVGGSCSEVVERPPAVILSSNVPHNSKNHCSSHGSSHDIPETSSRNDSFYNGERDGLDCNSLDDSGKRQTLIDVVVENLHDEILGFGSSIDLNSCTSEGKPPLTICSVTPERDLEPLANSKGNGSPGNLEVLASPKDDESPSQLEELANPKDSGSPQHLEALASPKDNDGPSQLEELANPKGSGSPLHLEALASPKDNESLSQPEALASPKGSESLPYLAFASPKDDESPLLCIESERNQLETFSELPEQGDGESLEELISIAAEAIVSISSEVQVQPCRETITFRPSDSPWIGPLLWFSRIANSVVDDPESEFGVVLSCKDTNHHNPSHGFDYFEAMTVQLKDTQTKEYCCKTNVEKDVASFPTSFPSQPKKHRTRRGRPQRKDFQSEVLPTLASLSRYEVTEDLHVMKGLIEAARAGWNTGTRKGGRNGCSWRRRRSTCPPIVENIVAVRPKPRTRNRECSIVKQVVEWGKITRRPRGARCRAGNPWLVLAQV